MESLIINLISGAVGGNIGGMLLKNFTLGTVGNSIVGILGGGIGAAILGVFGLSGGGAGTLEISNIISSIVSGGVGGGVLLVIVGFIRKLINK